MNNDEKVELLMKYCYSFQKSGSIKRCARLIGRCLGECEATKEDVKIARLLLTILEGEESA